MLEWVLSKTVGEGSRSSEKEDCKDRKSVEEMKGEKEMENWKTKIAFLGGICGHCCYAWETKQLV